VERPSKLGRWIDRHGLWLGVGLAIFVVGFGEMSTRILGPVVNEKIDEMQERFRSSGCFQEGWEALRQDTNAVARLGNGIKTDGFITGSMPLDSVRGEAKFSVNVKGSRNEANLTIDCDAEDGAWRLRTVLLTNMEQRIHMRIVP
jgi:hypothetical protein